MHLPTLAAGAADRVFEALLAVVVVIVAAVDKPTAAPVLCPILQQSVATEWSAPLFGMLLQLSGMLAAQLLALSVCECAVRLGFGCRSNLLPAGRTDASTRAFRTEGPAVAGAQYLVCCLVKYMRCYIVV